MYKLYLMFESFSRESNELSLSASLRAWLMRNPKESILAVRQSAYDLIASIDTYLANLEEYSE